MVYKHDKPDWKGIKGLVRQLQRAGQRVYNGAYMVRGQDGVDKIGTIIDFNIRPLVEKVKPKIDDTSMKNTWLAIRDAYGFGSFMAGQVVSDLRWAWSGPWNDKKLWAPLGPGSMRGMNRVLGRDFKTPIPQDEFEQLLVEKVISPGQSLPDNLTNRMEGIDWQNSLCEMDKYERALHGEGRPKQLYKPSLK
jgi:hypothetical protein